jgi:uncharacterized protein involved in outer membrane biogenesis
MLLLFSALLLAEWAGWPFLRSPLQQQLQKTLRVPVSLQGPFRLQLLWRPSLAIGKIQLDAAPGVGVERLLDAEALLVRWQWRELWSHQNGQPWLLREVSARRLQARLVRLADGRNSWSASPSAPREAANASVRDTLPVRVALLQLEDGDILYRDAITAVDLQVKVRGEELEGGASRISATAQGSWRQRPLFLQASAGGGSALLQAGDVVPLALQGRIGATEFSFRGVAADLFSARALRGSLLVLGPSLAAVGDALGVALPSTPSFRLAAAFTHDAGLWTILTTQARIGGSSLQANLNFDTRQARPLLSGRLGGELLRLKDLGPAIGAAPPADTPKLSTVLDESGLPNALQTPAPVAPARTARPGRVLPNRSFDLRALHAMDADVQVAIDVLDLGDDAVIAPLRDLAAQLTLRSGVLNLADLQAKVAGGRMSGSTSLTTNPASSAARWQADLRLVGVQVEQWWRRLKANADARDTGNSTPFLSGRMAARLQVQGTGNSTASILASLQGQLGASLRKGTVSHLLVELAGLDVAQALGVYVRGDGPLPLNCVNLQGSIHQGLVRTQHGILDTRDSTLLVTGQLNLADESLALRAEVKPKDFSPLSLRTPLVVGGTLAAPEVGVDQRRLITRVAAALVLGAAAPPAALLALLDLGSETAEGEDPCAAVR